MNGLKKLKIVILVLFIIGLIGIIFSFWVTSIEEENTLEVYDELSSEDQQTVSNFYNKLNDYGGLYMVIGYLYYAVIGGLFIVLIKLWNLNKL